MSGHVFRGKGSGLAPNKIIKAVLLFPKTNMQVWINDGFAFTVNPVDYAETVRNTVQGRYICMNSFFNPKARTGKTLDKSRFRSEAHFHSMNEPDGILHRLCQMFLAGTGTTMSPKEGIMVKTRLHSNPKAALSGGRRAGGKSSYFHEVQFVAGKRVRCVWKLERDGVGYGEDEEGNKADDLDNMRAAISEMSSAFPDICDKGRAALGWH